MKKPDFPLADYPAAYWIKDPVTGGTRMYDPEKDGTEGFEWITSFSNEYDRDSRDYYDDVDDPDDF